MSEFRRFLFFAGERENSFCRIVSFLCQGIAHVDRLQSGIMLNLAKIKLRERQPICVTVVHSVHSAGEQESNPVLCVSDCNFCISRDASSLHGFRLPDEWCGRMPEHSERRCSVSDMVLWRDAVHFFLRPQPLFFPRSGSA